MDNLPFLNTSPVAIQSLTMQLKDLDPSNILICLLLLHSGQY